MEITRDYPKRAQQLLLSISSLIAYIEIIIYDSHIGSDTKCRLVFRQPVSSSPEAL